MRTQTAVGVVPSAVAEEIAYTAVCPISQGNPELETIASKGPEEVRARGSGPNLQVHHSFARC